MSSVPLARPAGAERWLNAGTAAAIARVSLLCG